MAGVVVEADDALLGDAEGISDEGKALGLGDAELSARGIDEAALGAPLPHLFLDGPAGRRPRDAVVLLDVVFVVEHAVEPLARCGPRARQRDEGGLRRR